MSAEDDKRNEKAILGAVLLDPRCLNEVAETLHPGDFSTLLGEHIYAEMLAMREEGVPIDDLTLADRLGHDEPFTRAGGLPVLIDLRLGTPTASNVAYYVRPVVESAAKRRAKAALTRGLQLLDGGDVGADEVLDLAGAELHAATRVNGALRWIGHGIDEHVQALNEPVTYLPTPWPALNHVIGGFAPGRLYVVGARPSVGKSITGVQCATVLARYGTVSLSSLEMSHDEIRERVLADVADVTLDEIQGHAVPDAAWPRLLAAVDQVRHMDIVIDDRTSISAFDVGNQARAIARRSTLVGVVIDYVQLMSGTARRNRQEEVAEFSRQLKLLARSLGVPVIALAQLNRGPEGRDGLPKMSDLRESGALEQDADVVILMSRKVIEDPQTGKPYESPTEVMVNVDKNRHGRSKEIFTLHLDGAYARLRNPTLPGQGLGGPTYSE